MDIWKAMTLSYNLAYQEIILVHPTRRQIFAGKPYWVWHTLLFGTSETFSYTIVHTHHNFQSSLLGGQSNEAKISNVVLHSILVNDGWNKAINHLQNIICFWLSNVWVSLISDFFTDPSTIKIIIAEFLWNWKLQFHFVVTLKTNLRLSLSKQAHE